MSLPWCAKILTLFPDMFPGPLGHSILGQALEKNIWSCDTVNIRNFATDKHRTVDDTPAGGGPGMVMRADIIASALDHARKGVEPLPVLYMSPRGTPFTQQKANELAAKGGAIFLCGRFEGVDERLLQARQIEEVSAGDFVLSGGEIAAMIMLDAILRLLPGVLGAQGSLVEESFETGLLEYPHYTRPRIWEGLEIPEVLLSGNHARIEQWRQDQAEKITQERRPDLWERYRAQKA